MCDELAQRKRAVQLYYYQQQSKAEICRQLNRSRPWLDRWLARYDPDDVVASLSNQAPGRKPSEGEWSAEIREQVLQMRQQRMDRDTQPYSLIGATAIHYELVALGSPEVPPPRTIHRWLSAAGLITPRPPTTEPDEPKAIPLPAADSVNRRQQLDLKGPLYLRGSDQKYYIAVLRDCYSRRCALDILTNRQATSIVEFLVASWQWLGQPTYLQMDNALELQGCPGRHPRSFGQVVRLALDVAVEPLFNPPSEPWRNGGVERYNRFLSERLLTVECADERALRQAAARCQAACNQTHRLAALDGQTPNELSRQVDLRLLPATYRGHTTGTLAQNKGFVSFIRLVRRSGRITLGKGDRFMVDPELAYTYVLARVNLAAQQVTISQADEPILTYDYSLDTIAAWADGQ
jgi:putative transposase